MPCSFIRPAHHDAAAQVAIPFAATSFKADTIYTFVCYANNADGTSAPSNSYSTLMCARGEPSPGTRPLHSGHSTCTFACHPAGLQLTGCISCPLFFRRPFPPTITKVFASGPATPILANVFPPSISGGVTVGFTYTLVAVPVSGGANITRTTTGLTPTQARRCRCPVARALVPVWSCSVLQIAGCASVVACRCNSLSQLAATLQAQATPSSAT